MTLASSGPSVFEEIMFENVNLSDLCTHMFLCVCLVDYYINIQFIDLNCFEKIHCLSIFPYKSIRTQI